jgi:hypothetical protein
MGCLLTLSSLSCSYPPTTYLEVYGCCAKGTCSLLKVCMALMANSTLMLDLATHQTLITLATQLFAGFSLFSLDVFCYFCYFFLNRLCKSRCKRATDRKRLAFSESPFRHRGFLSVRSCYSRPKCILLCS